MISRRGVLQAGLVSAAGWAIAPPFLFGIDDSVSLPGKEGMIVRSLRFLDLEMPPEFFNSWITPVPHFFVRNHMHEPDTLEASAWRLTFGGEIDNPLTLTLPQLTKLDTHSVINTLECAGNGRAFQQPHVPGVQWQRGAIGTARFSGPRLRDLLERARVKPKGKHIMFRGLDDVPGKVPPFIRSIPIDKAMDPDTLVATHMNGAMLTKHHGFPARALVPGWIGAASCKWLTEITVLNKEFDGNFMKPGYRVPDQPVPPGGDVNPEATHAITGLAVKSVITSPVEGAHVGGTAIHLRGAAWAGEADVVRVDFSPDKGATWHSTQLSGEHAKYAWRLWSYKWSPRESGDYILMSRATDNQGRTQAESAAWNPSGYLYNAIDRVKIHVEI
jgi:DMSO/TMAO reductase YedYZ molybdopterin-dependent catalytic subunit